ncbi:glycosyltransferase family 1 protein [Neobacillus sp. NPDC058068]|uniref:glycosyltransferase family 1 protein n=1 Tax=Neobacillus sp. NPDC058068 TaxID=3346325 RepID=UPI0036DDC0A0
MKKNGNTKRLLCIVGSMNAGGAETFLMKVYRALDKNKYQMDFYVASKEEGFYEEEIISMGGKIHRSIPKSKRIVKSFNTLKDIVRKEKYDYVMRISQHSLSTIDLLAAKFGGAKVLVFRSSNTKTYGGRVHQILHLVFKWLSITIPNIKIAPSTEAAEFMFGKGCIQRKKAIILKNAIALDNFHFDLDTRTAIREEFQIKNKFVVGHVGRFNNAKNHSFLIDVFNEIVKKHKESVLILVGKGELESDIKNKIKTLGLTDKVIFTGVRSDVPNIMMAMDVLIFPSFFEGMPNVIIEAQATGLHCIISDSITREAGITKLVDYLSLKDSTKIWAEKALEYRQEDVVRESMNDKFKIAGYDIDSVTDTFVRTVFIE